MQEHDLDETKGEKTGEMNRCVVRCEKVWFEFDFKA